LNKVSPRSLVAEANRRDTRWITATVALLATVVFAISGSQIMPYLVAGPEGIQSVAREEAAAFLLNIALLLFAWRRSSQLRQTFDERDAWEQRAVELAYRDEVTGLFNRRHLKESFDYLISRTDSEYILLLIDLDHFKKVNDLYGHDVGDELLAITGKRIRDLCPKDAICARLGGDEFAVMLSAETCDWEKAKELASKLVEELKAPARIANSDIQIGASIGVLHSSTGHETLGELLRGADAAMYEAKRHSGNCWIEFDRKMETETQRRISLEAEMRAGLASKEFIPYFQPIIDLSSGELRGFEVLARWQNPTRGLMEPPEFLEIANSSGLIAELSLTVMKDALTIARPWPGHLKIAVNVSPVQFKDPLLAARIIDLLKTTEFPARRLDLEIAENSLIADHAFALTTIRKLKEIGIGIVVDDFGTGYASVTRLKKLPFDRLKIDRSFVDSMDGDKDSDALVKAIAMLGKGLSVPVSAEGIETEAMQAKLVGMGCVDAQGWLFSKALTPEEVELGFWSGSFKTEFVRPWSPAAVVA
jgi:diguanylate cyclase (GGDEF)-like protein